MIINLHVEKWTLYIILSSYWQLKKTVVIQSNNIYWNKFNIPLEQREYFLSILSILNIIARNLYKTFPVSGNNVPCINRTIAFSNRICIFLHSNLIQQLLFPFTPCEFRLDLHRT